MSRVVVHSRRLDPGIDATPVLGELLAALGGLEGRVSAGDRVVIKPNFVAPFPAATTDLAVIGWIAERVRDAGGVPLVAESSGYEFDAEATFKVLGVREFCAQRRIDLVNLDDAEYVRMRLSETGHEVELARCAAEADLVINLPVLKGHTITKVTGAVKNFFGLLSRESRRRLHVSGLHAGIADLAGRFPSSLHLADARQLLVRAVFSTVRPLGFFLAADDPFALDHFGSGLLGVDPDSVRHLSRVPDYEIDGALPEGRDELSRRDTARDRVHRAMYSAFYLVDEVRSRTVGGTSIIPHLHWTLGVHPALAEGLSDAELERLASICPVGAIDVQARRIIAEKCRPVRCMTCLREAEPGSVVLKGLNPPKEQKR